MFSLRRFFRPRQTQPFIQERTLLEALIQAEKEETARQRARWANHERPNSPNGGRQDGDLPVDEVQRLPQTQVSLLDQQKANVSVFEVDTD